MNINRAQYRKGLCNTFYRKLYRKLFKRTAPYGKLNGQSVITSPKEANDWISDLIRSGKPFFLGRFGSTELLTINNYYCKQLGKQVGFSEDCKYKMSNNSGFFPATDEMLSRFSELMLTSCANLDGVGLWNDRQELFTVSSYAKNARGIELGCLEPYYHIENSWTKALEGKKILIVHPFAESIAIQETKKDKLFTPDFWPNCKWIPYRAVQTIAGEKDERFATWFDALDHMKNEISKIDFDFAVVGCGAYGFPLASAIKEMGKQVIHMGGATQILFGVRAKRWENNAQISSYFNENWVYPNENEKPKNASRVEGGCYW